MRNGFIFLCILFNFSCYGQQSKKPAYMVGAIPQPARFEKLTAYEVRIDSLKEKHNRETIAALNDESAFEEGVPEKQKQEMRDYEMTVRQPYRDNRSRYFIKRFINKKLDKEFLSNVVDTFTTECTCYLSNDTIKVNMGIWVFGGLGFNIIINKNTFNSAYWEDEHKQKIYKTTLRQTRLSGNVLVRNETQELILKDKPTFAVGENILGYLTFKTNNYFISADYQQGFAADSYSDAKMNPVYMQGELYFKCKLRKKTWADE